MAADEETLVRAVSSSFGLLERAQKKNPSGTKTSPARRQRDRPHAPRFSLEEGRRACPRLPEIWRDLAKTQFDAKQFPEAERSWRAAERVARNDQEREQLTRPSGLSRPAMIWKPRARPPQEGRSGRLSLRREGVRCHPPRGGGRATPASPRLAAKWRSGATARRPQPFGTLESVACQGGKARLSARGEGKPASFLSAIPTRCRDPRRQTDAGAAAASEATAQGEDRLTPRREVVTVEFQ